MPLETLIAQAADNATEAPALVNFLAQSFYPILFGIFVVASLGVPIPEDLPLIAAGIILKTQPDVAAWLPTYIVSLCGIMSGDIILYSLGRKWGVHVFEHRWVNRLITPRHLSWLTGLFDRWGMAFVFFGRFIVGIRAMMCLAAGVTRYSFVRFVIADLCGALLSVLLFIGLGYFFADNYDTLHRWIQDTQWALFAIAAAVIVGIIVLWRLKRRVSRAIDAQAIAADGAE